VPSLGELIDQVISELHGYTVDQPQQGTLVGDIDAAATELALDFGQQPGAARPAGLIEIGTELLAVQSYDPNTGIALLGGAWARGQRNTVAAAHTAGSMVTVRPRYPRKQVGDVIRQVIRASCPPLFAAKDLDPITVGELVNLSYPLPAGTRRVLRVEELPDGPPELVWRHRVNQWDVRDLGAGAKELVLPWYLPPYVTVNVVIATDPGELVNDDDDFATVTGLPASCADLVVFGALARLVLAGEAARQQVSSVEQAGRNAQIPSGSSSTLSRYYQALYTQRLQGEQQGLQQTYPLQMQYRRG
jgi:hypothetical protein